MRHDTCGFCRHHLCGDYRSAPRTALCVFWRKERRPAPCRGAGRNAPAAIMAALVVYCLKSVPFGTMTDGAKQLIAAAAVVALHLWKKNTLLSIGRGNGAVYAADPALRKVKDR